MDEVFKINPYVKHEIMIEDSIQHVMDESSYNAKPQLFLFDSKCVNGEAALVKSEELEYTSEHKFEPLIVEELNIKRENAHSKENPVRCGECDYSTTRKRDLVRHLMMHTDKKPFNCSLCEYRTANKQHLQIHVIRHTGEKPLKCDKCDYRTSQSSNLKRHHMSHTAQKPYKCDECDYATKEKRCFQLHVIKHQVKPSKNDKVST